MHRPSPETDPISPPPLLVHRRSLAWRLAHTVTAHRGCGSTLRPPGALPGAVSGPDWVVKTWEHWSAMECILGVWHGGSRTLSSPTEAAARPSGLRGPCRGLFPAQRLQVHSPANLVCLGACVHTLCLKAARPPILRPTLRGRRGPSCSAGTAAFRGGHLCPCALLLSYTTTPRSSSLLFARSRFGVLT